MINPHLRPCGVLDEFEEPLRHYRDLDAQGQIPARVSVQVGDVDAALKGAAHVVSGSFAHHYAGHTPIGPACCVASWTVRTFRNSP